jgi:uncharacterized membrane protein YjgN (DUF898 family)
MNATAPLSSPGRECPLEFRASGGEYFGIWIVNLLLSIVTLGIYSAWAKVRRLRYFYGSTFLDGSSFEYHGSPKAILKGRVIAVVAYGLFAIAGQISPVATLLVMPLFILGIPWVIMRARKFQMRMTSWRNLRFNFHGQYRGAMGAFIGWPLLGVLTLFILWPYALWKQARYLLGNAAFGTERAQFVTPSGRYYRFCLAALGMGIALAAVVAALVSLLTAARSGAGVAAQSMLDPRAQLRAYQATAVLIIPVVALLGSFIAAYFKASRVNGAFGGVEIGPHRVQSNLRTLPLFGILITNLLAMVVTLGLFYPWAKVRAMRYQITHTSVLVNGDLGQFVADASASSSAVGEEVGEFFDIDFGI